MPVLLLGLALVLLLYIGYGKAQHTYPDLRLDSLAAVGEIVRNSLQTFLAAGLPLHQFVGFATLTQPVLLSEPSINEIRVIDKTGKMMFNNARSGSPGLGQNTIFLRDRGRYSIYENDRFYILSLDLNSKFETVASLEIITEKKYINQRIKAVFMPAVIAAIFLLLGYFVLAFLTERGLARRANLWIRGFYVLAFVIVAILVMATLIGLLSSGVQEKGRALSKSLAARLAAALDMGIDLSSFTELDTMFREYRDLNAEIKYIALTENDIVAIHTQDSLVGTNWESQGGAFEFFQTLQAEPDKRDIRFGVSKKLLYRSLWRYGKDFVVLLIASGFLSALFLNLTISFKRKSDLVQAELTLEAEQGMKRDLIKPVYFLAIFMEGLHASFLPQYMKHIATESGLGAGAASAVFMAYFAAYTLCIIPSGWFAQRRSSKPLIATGAVLSAGGLLLLSVFRTFGLVLLFRMLSGAGGGMLFIGVQSYILKHTTRETRTQGGAIIVYGYNGGTLSGAAIGAMLALYIGMKGVFIMGAVVGATILLYSLRYIPATPPSVKKVSGSKGSFRGLLGVFGDISFVKTVLLVGIPTKMILTGVTIYALPLILSLRAFPQEDIGQILMFYAAGVLISSRYASRLADRLKNTRYILFLGMLGAGIGLGLIGLMNWQVLSSLSIPFLGALLVITGMLVLGLSHGFIHAPIVTHITDTRSAKALGQASVASLYRFLERLGHVTGPLIVSGVLVAMNDNILSIGLIGMVVVAFGLVFVTGGKKIGSERRMRADV
ncbi:MAG: MFS transporter [Spirochaetaceae bacterium]|nr:MAG: MFS transporter [Spirochaetaceae bacterium]